MEITFTKEELEKYAQDLENWYNQRATYVFTKMLELTSQQTYGDPYGRRGDKELYHKFAKEFQTKNPKPDWRSLL